jgi:hypothetical protein
VGISGVYLYNTDVVAVSTTANAGLEQTDSDTGYRKPVAAASSASHPHRNSNSARRDTAKRSTRREAGSCLTLTRSRGLWIVCCSG